MKIAWASLAAACLLLTGCASSAEKNQALVEDLTSELKPIDLALRIERSAIACVANTDESPSQTSAKLLEAFGSELAYYLRSATPEAAQIASLREVYAPAFDEAAIAYRGAYSCRTANLGRYNKALSLVNAEMSSVLSEISEDNFSESIGYLNALQTEANAWTMDYVTWIKREAALLGG